MRNSGVAGPYCKMKTIKIKPSLRVLRARAWIMRVISRFVPLRFLRRGYLKAFYRVWEAEQVTPSPDPTNVYDNGIEWSRRPLPTKEADRLLELHDAATEVHSDLDFTKLLDRHLPH